MGCNFAKAAESMTSNWEDFRIARALFDEYGQIEDLRLGDAAFVGYERELDVEDAADRAIVENEVIEMMERASGGDGTVSWSVNGKGSLSATTTGSDISCYLWI